MPQVEILPQSLAKARRIVLKPRLDQANIQLIGEKIKPRLFSRFGFKIRSEHVRLIRIERYFEPYLIIGGKYVLEYCKKHTFNMNIKDNTNKIFVGGQEFRSEKTEELEPDSNSKTFKLFGESYAHYERQAYYILDRMIREIPPEKLPVSPFDIKRNNLEQCSNFRKIQISDETQIEFLKMKIAQRPVDVAEIIRENFDITDRIIAYYPMYQLTFENTRKQTDAMVTINGITGEIILNRNNKLSIKTTVTFSNGAQLPQQEQKITVEKKQTTPILGIIPLDLTDHTQKEETRSPELDACHIIASDTIDNIPKEETELLKPEANETMVLGFPARILGDVTEIDDKVTTVVGDVGIPSGSNIDKDLIVKGALRIGDNCRGHGKLKAYKDITIGADTIIDGDLISGGNIFVGPRSLINGTVEAVGVFAIEKDATVEVLCASTSRQ